MTEDERYHWSAIVGINHDVPAIQAANDELNYLRARIEVLEKELQAEKDVAQAAFNVAMEGK